MPNETAQIEARKPVVIRGSVEKWMEGDAEPFVCITPDERDTLVLRVRELEKEVVGYAEALASSKEHNRKMKKRRDGAGAERDRYREIVRWAFDRIALGYDFDETEFLDKLELAGIVEARAHDDSDIPGTSVSLFWKDSTTALTKGSR